MRIVVTGTRGIPGIQGGVETHCEELFPRVVDENHEVIVVRRPEYISKGHEAATYKGVKIKDLKTLPGKHLEAFTHTLRAVWYAKTAKADIVHIHAVGPSIAVPFSRMLGMKTVMTHHGPDYNRDKWGKFAKAVIRTGEKWGVKYASHVIVISKFIQNLCAEKYPSQKNVSLIYNGVQLQCPPSQDDYLRELGLQKRGYVLAVGRFVKEKCFDLLVRAFSQIAPEGVKLVIAGDADHEDAYSLELKELAKKNGVVLTGFIQKDKLAQLYANARLFVLPSTHEGLPISLLEAMNGHCDVLVSDIPANTEVGLPKEDYFITGNETDLVEHLKQKLAKAPVESVEYDMSHYNWDIIAQQTRDVYDSLMK